MASVIGRINYNDFLEIEDSDGLIWVINANSISYVRKSLIGNNYIIKVGLYDVEIDEDTYGKLRVKLLVKEVL